MHGDFESDNIVFKEDDYLDYSTNFPLIESFIRGIFASKVVLFVGFSFNDNNLKYIIERVRNILKNNFQPIYFFSPEEEISPIKSEYLQNRGLSIINYHKRIKYYLINNVSQNLSRLEYYKGENLSNFLSFINTYKKLPLKYKDLHIVEKIKKSLERFSELPSIPPNNLVQLYPFSFKKQATYTQGHHLSTLNESILQLFHFLEVKEGKIHIKDKRIKKYETDLKTIFIKLNKSGILCIKQQNNNSKENHNNIRIYGNDTMCECYRCLYENFNLKKLLSKINGETAHLLQKRHNLPDELINAYGLLKVGRYLEVYFLLNKMASQSWHNDKYITYFICKYNLHQLYGSIDSLFSPDQINNELKQQILQDIENIDLDSIIQKLPLDKEVKRVLINIKNQTLKKRLEQNINDYLLQIKDTYSLYQNGGKRMGKQDILYLQQTIITLSKFYRLNCLFDTNFSGFKNLILKVWEGLLVSYQTNENYEWKLKEFYPYFLEIAILYAPPQDLLKLFQSYNPHLLKISEANTHKFIDKSITFLQSNYEEYTFLGYTLKANTLFEQQAKNSIQFKQQCNYMLSNILVLLAYLDDEFIPEENGYEFTSSLIKHIQIDLEINGQGNSTHYEQPLLLLIERKIHLFEQKTLNKLIELSLTTRSRFTKDFPPKFTQAITNLYPDYKIEIPDIIIKLNNIIDDKENSIHIDDFLHYWKILKEQDQKAFKAKLIQSIENNPIYDWDLYKDAVWHRIISYNYKEQIFKQYQVDFITRYLNAANQYELNETGIHIPNHNWTPYNLIIKFAFMVYQNNIPIRQIQHILKHEDTPDYLLWILKPQSFDYTQFQPEWLIDFADEVFHPKLKKVKDPLFKESIQNFLKQNFYEKLAKIYFQLFG